MKYITLLALIFVYSFAFKLAPTMFKSDSDKVKIDLYFQSLCPACQQFMTRSAKNASIAKDFWKICEFNIYPYGNAVRRKNGSSWSFQCQHGPLQCEFNMVQTCAIKKYDYYNQGLPFVICLENGGDLATIGKRCAKSYNMNWDQIYKCSQTQEGINYELEIAQATQVLSPPKRYTPWIIVNNLHTESAQNAVYENMVRYVCSIYRGPEKVDACKRYSYLN